MAEITLCLIQNIDIFSWASLWTIFVVVHICACDYSEQQRDSFLTRQLGPVQGSLDFFGDL